MYLMDEVAHGKWENKKTYTAISIAILTFVLAVLLMFATPIFANPTAEPNTGTPNLPLAKTESTLPTGEEFNSALKNTPVLDENGNPVVDENGEPQVADNSNLIKTITFDYFSDENAYSVNGVNVIEGIEPVEISEDVYLYRVVRDNDFQDLYILSTYKICTDKDASSLFKDLKVLEEVFFNNFDTSAATTMAKMFYNTRAVLYLDLNFNTENVTDMSEMFYYCNALSLDLSNFKTEKLTTMNSMFKWCNASAVDMSSFDTRNVTDMTDVFYSTSIFSLYASDLWVIPQNETSKNLFEYSRRMVGTFGTKWINGSENYQNNISEKNARLDKPGAPGYFCDVSQKLPVDLPVGFKMNDIIKGKVSGDKRFVTSITFDYYTGENAYVVNGENIIAGLEPEKISKTVNLYRVASGENKCDVYILSNTTIHVSQDASDMFFNEIENPRPEGGPFYYLTKIVFNNFDTTATVDMGQMFGFCLNVEELDLSGFNTCNVTSMFSTFSFCYNLKKLNLSSFNTSKVYDMDQTFIHCDSLTELDLSNFDTANVQSMYLMFSGCYSLEKLNVTSFNTFNVSSMWGMFRGCTFAELDLSSFSLQNMRGSTDGIFQGNFKPNSIRVSDVRFINQSKLYKDIFKLV